MKKLTAILLALVMLASCALALAEAPNTELTGEITFYTAFAGANGTDALIAQFNELYPNVKVNYEVYKNSSDGNVGLDTAIIAGGQVDVLRPGGKLGHRRLSV